MAQWVSIAHQNKITEKKQHEAQRVMEQRLVVGLTYGVGEPDERICACGAAFCYEKQP